MSDQCRTCTIRGDIRKCLDTECFKHEDWWAKTVLVQLAEAQKEIEQLKDEIVDLQEQFKVWKER